MKKQNSRFRNGNNNGYTLNYKFDSVSIAGKISGTALDLIRRYNDLAKEAQSSGNYVDMEIYRQYAEHYRKIVTDINERRQFRYEQSKTEDNAPVENEASEENNSDNTEVAETETPAATPEEAPNGYVETLPAAEPAKSFQVVEISDNAVEGETAPKAKRVYRRRTPVAKKTAEV